MASQSVLDLLPLTVPADVEAPRHTSDEHAALHGPLQLDLLTEAQLPELAEICQDPEIQRWTTVPSPYGQAEARGFFELTHAAAVEGREYHLAISTASQTGSPRLLGMMALVPAPQGSLSQGNASIGYYVAASARGHGVTERTLRTLIEFAFDPAGPLALRRLQWDALVIDDVPNWASWRTAWAVGFQREAHRRHSTLQRGKVCDEWTASLLATDPREPQGPWDGPTPASREPLGRGNGSAHTAGAHTPLIAHKGTGAREGDNPEALVRRFHDIYGLPIQTDGPSLDRASLHMRMSLIAEEFTELIGSVYGPQARSVVEQATKDAVAADDGTRDLVETADALADLVYVIYGMALEMGIDLAAVLSEVQRSNMSKLGEDGKPIYREDGKVLEGPGYFAPDVAGILGQKRR